MALIEVKGASKLYGSGHQQVAALSDINLTVERGEFTALAGPSGSGKTTLLNLIGCLDQPTAGCIELDGIEVGRSTVTQMADFRLHRIGFIFQSYNLIPVLSAEENAEFILMLQGVPRAERQRRVRETLQRLGLEGLEGRRPADLSGGQQQRVAVARAIVAEPAVVLADEPTANLDSVAATELLTLMGELNRERGVTFLFSSHDPLVLEHARRVVQLHDGRLVDDERKLEDPGA